MGYRSQVYVGVPPTKSKELEKLKWEFIDKTKSTFLDLFTPVKKNWDEGMYIYRGDSLKWYDGYKDVDSITEFIEDCEGFIVAIGQDDAIHSTTGEYFEYLDIRTEVDIL